MILNSVLELKDYSDDGAKNLRDKQLLAIHKQIEHDYLYQYSCRVGAKLIEGIASPYGGLHITLWNIFCEVFWVHDHHVKGNPGCLLVCADILCPAGVNQGTLTGK